MVPHVDNGEGSLAFCVGRAHGESCPVDCANGYEKFGPDPVCGDDSRWVVDTVCQRSEECVIEPQWTPWGLCSSSCSPGQRFRQRRVVNFVEEAGCEAIVDTEPCNTHLDENGCDQATSSSSSLNNGGTSQ